MVTVNLFTNGDATEISKMNYEFNNVLIPPKEIRLKRMGSKGNEIVVVAKYNSQHAGFACAQVFHSICYQQCSAEITEIFVREKYRRKNVGKALLSHLEAMLKSYGATKITVLTQKNNYSAKKLYASLGYRKKHYCVYIKTRSGFN